MQMTLKRNGPIEQNAGDHGHDGLSDDSENALLSEIAAVHLDHADGSSVEHGQGRAQRHGGEDSDGKVNPKTAHMLGPVTFGRVGSHFEFSECSIVDLNGALDFAVAQQSGRRLVVAGQRLTNPRPAFMAREFDFFHLKIEFQRRGGIEEDAGAVPGMAQFHARLLTPSLAFERPPRGADVELQFLAIADRLVGGELKKRSGPVADQLAGSFNGGVEAGLSGGFHPGVHVEQQ